MGLNNNEQDRNVKIYAITALEIFRQCFDRAGIGSYGNMFLQLELAISNVDPRHYITDKYLRNKYSEIRRKIDNSSNSSVTFRHSMLQTLCDFAGIKDYLEFDKLISRSNQNTIAQESDSAIPAGFLSLRNRLHSDEYNIDEDDVLGYDLHAYNLFHIMNDKQTCPPLNVGILAPWGRGKTTLMKKLEKLFSDERLKALNKIPGKEIKHLRLRDLKAWFKGKTKMVFPKIPHATVWFNPWNYQSSEMIWAGMANQIVEQVVNDANGHVISVLGTEMVPPPLPH